MCNIGFIYPQISNSPAFCLLNPSFLPNISSPTPKLALLWNENFWRWTLTFGLRFIWNLRRKHRIFSPKTLPPCQMGHLPWRNFKTRQYTESKVIRGGTQDWWFGSEIGTGRNPKDWDGEFLQELASGNQNADLSFGDTSAIHHNRDRSTAIYCSRGQEGEGCLAKGVPGSECRTGSWLVGCRQRLEKKKWTSPIFCPLELIWAPWLQIFNYTLCEALKNTEIMNKEWRLSPILPNFAKILLKPENLSIAQRGMNQNG